jgi:hypothetical protein
MSRILIILSVLVLVSCTESLDIQLEPEVSIFIKGDSEKEISLTSKDKEYVLLNEWLRENSSDWHPTSGRYHGDVYIKSGDYGFQISKTNVVLYSTDSPKPKAIYVQQIDKGELSEIRNFGK